MSAVTRIFINEKIRVRFTPAEVWAVLSDVEAYPRWWPASLPVSVERIGASLQGSEIRVRPRFARPFSFRFEECEEPEAFRIRFLDGVLDGPGYFFLERTEEGTRVRAEIDIVARGYLSAILARVLPVSRFHARHLRKVLRSFNRRLKARRPRDSEMLPATS